MIQVSEKLQPDQQQEKEFNKIYDDYVHKYTLNIPLPVWGEITNVCRINKIDRSFILRKILFEIFMHQESVSLKDIVSYLREDVDLEISPHNKLLRSFFRSK